MAFFCLSIMFFFSASGRCLVVTWVPVIYGGNFCLVEPTSIGSWNICSLLTAYLLSTTDLVYYYFLLVCVLWERKKIERKIDLRGAMKKLKAIKKSLLLREIFFLFAARTRNFVEWMEIARQMPLYWIFYFYYFLFSSSLILLFIGFLFFGGNKKIIKSYPTHRLFASKPFLTIVVNTTGPASTPNQHGTNKRL